MANGKPIRLYVLLGDTWTYAFHPAEANRVNSRLVLVRQNYYTLRLQFVRTTDLSLDTADKPAASQVVSLADYEDIIFGLKEAVDDTDFAAAWRGYNTGDTAWHSLASGRASIDVAPTTTIDLATYKGVVRLLNGTSYLDAPDLPWDVQLRQNVVTGDEPGTPSGALDGNSYTGTITNGNDSVAITVPNMTATGRVVPFFIGAPVSTIGATCGSGAVTVQIGGPAAGNVSVGIYVVQTS